MRTQTLGSRAAARTAIRGRPNRSLVSTLYRRIESFWRIVAPGARRYLWRLFCCMTSPVRLAGVEVSPQKETKSPTSPRSPRHKDFVPSFPGARNSRERWKNSFCSAQRSVEVLQNEFFHADFLWPDTCSDVAPYLRTHTPAPTPSRLSWKEVWPPIEALRTGQEMGSCAMFVVRCDWLTAARLCCTGP